MVKPSLPVAVDTNFLLQLAEGNDDAWDVLEILSGRLKPHERIATPTVLEELAYHSRNLSAPDLAAKARRALGSFRLKWGFEPRDFSSSEREVEKLARQLLRRKVLPETEYRDARILAESAFSKSFLLISEDSHLVHADKLLLALCLHEWQLAPPVILTARELVRKFYR